MMLRACVLGAAAPPAGGAGAERAGRLGPAAREALPGLRKLLDDPDAAVRKRATQAVQRINAP
jgi:hypothetical protein